jgi:hypothetical protein
MATAEMRDNARCHKDLRKGLALRRALSDVPREAFDAGLNSLRHASRFSLDSADGRHVPLPQAVLDAGLREGPSLLVYAARR